MVMSSIPIRVSPRLHRRGPIEALQKSSVPNGQEYLHALTGVAQLKPTCIGKGVAIEPYLHAFTGVAQLKHWVSNGDCTIIDRSPRLHRRGPIEALRWCVQTENTANLHAFTGVAQLKRGLLKTS